MLTPERLAELRQDRVFEAELCGHRLLFHSTWGLFSPREIDEGTRLLLQQVEVAPDDDCLDLGCGYGPIGLTLARLAPRGQTLLVDKDFVAVEYSNANARRNGLVNARAQLSDAFRDLDPARRFDLIASNIPAKVGREALSLYLQDAHARLRPHGRLYLVTLNGLREFMKRHLQEIFGNYEKCKQGARYTVALARRAE